LRQFDSAALVVLETGRASIFPRIPTATRIGEGIVGQLLGNRFVT